MNTHNNNNNNNTTDGSVSSVTPILKTQQQQEEVDDETKETKVKIEIKNEIKTEDEVKDEVKDEDIDEDIDEDKDKEDKEESHVDYEFVIDIDDNNDDDNNDNNNDEEISDKLLISCMDSVEKNHRKVTFVRLFVKYKSFIANSMPNNELKIAFQSILDSAVQRKVVERLVNESDPSDVTYRQAMMTPKMTATGDQRKRKQTLTVRSDFSDGVDGGGGVGGSDGQQTGDIIGDDNKKDVKRPKLLCDNTSIDSESMVSSNNNNNNNNNNDSNGRTKMITTDDNTDDDLNSDLSKHLYSMQSIVNDDHMWDISADNYGYTTTTTTNNNNNNNNKSLSLKKSSTISLSSSATTTPLLAKSLSSQSSTTSSSLSSSSSSSSSSATTRSSPISKLQHKYKIQRQLCHTKKLAAAAASAAVTTGKAVVNNNNKSSSGGKDSSNNRLNNKHKNLNAKQQQQRKPRVSGGGGGGTAGKKPQINDDYRHWVCETLPRRTPFIGQIGDRVVYMMDAHQVYMKFPFMDLQDEYRLFKCSLDDIRRSVPEAAIIGEIHARILGIKFLQKHNIQFTLIQLETVDYLNTGSHQQFTVLYRPMAGIYDFLVLEKFHSDCQLMKSWSAGNEFKTIFRKSNGTYSWWFGRVVQCPSIFDQNYPQSAYNSVRVRFNYGDEDNLSPWDIYDVGDQERDRSIKYGLPVKRQHLLDTNYRPYLREWPEVDGVDLPLWRYHECRRIYKTLSAIDSRIDAKLVNSLQDYYQALPYFAYPITPAIIRERLNNMFYRRKEAIGYDLKLMRDNCRLFTHATDDWRKLLDQLCQLYLDVITDTRATDENCDEYVGKYEQLPRRSQSEISEEAAVAAAAAIDIEYIRGDGPPVLPSCGVGGGGGNSSSCESKKLKSKKNKSKQTKPRPKQSSVGGGGGGNSISCESKKLKSKKNKSKQTKPRPRQSSGGGGGGSSVDIPLERTDRTDSKKWKQDSQKFIDEMLKKDDTLPFRQPVDTNEFPQYLTVIHNPIDLSTIQKKLDSDIYMNPKDMRQDLRLMYENARVFNKNPRSRIRLITKELAKWSETKLREIIVDWDRVYAYERKLKSKQSATSTGLSTIRVREPIARQDLWGFKDDQYF
ncbi:bromodomain and WD repeat-containing protein 3-like [Oppia nitens]|uniref:bromodomain and WD repeat-containing protein 3-like n=1 Tax=Oppia nitens TaxID=1686743 RepID=UPI0023DBB130|nr:bromodomain and WD repeat-containing protein 3-like [Oppia nitens]